MRMDTGPPGAPQTNGDNKDFAPPSGSNLLTVPAIHMEHVHVNANDEHVNGNSCMSDDEPLVDIEQDLAARIKKHKEIIKDVFMTVYARHTRASSDDSRSPGSSPGDNHYVYYRSHPLGKGGSCSPPREVTYEEELQQRQQQLLDAVTLWKQKCKDRRAENVRLLATVQRCEEDCAHLVERISNEYQAAYDELKAKLADIVCYADDVTQERNRVERELRHSLERAKDHLQAAEKRALADKEEMQRLRTMTKRIEKERNNVIADHNKLKQENDALWEKVKRPDAKGPVSVAELKAKYDDKRPASPEEAEYKKKCHVLEMERDHYAILLETTLQRLQTYENGLQTLLRASTGGQPQRRSAPFVVNVQPGDATKISIMDAKNCEPRFSAIEEELTDTCPEQPLDVLVNGPPALDSSLDSQSAHSNSRNTSVSEDMSETDSLHCSPRHDGTESLASQQLSSSNDDTPSFLSSEFTPPNTRRFRGSIDTAMMYPITKSYSSADSPSPNSLKRSSSEHAAEREKMRPRSPSMAAASSASSQADDKATPAASSFGALRQRRGGVIELPSADLLDLQKPKKQKPWGRDILDKFKKKSNSAEKEDKDRDKDKGPHFWQRSKSRSVKARGEKEEKSSAA